MIITDFGEHEPPPGLPSVRVLQRFVATAARAIPLHGDLSVLLTSDRAIRSLNRQFRGKNKATDVLSFPAVSEIPGQPVVAGDLAISVDTAARQALLLEHSLANELKILILHGMLHLAGLDHENDQGQMAQRELKLRRQLRLTTGLIERTRSVNRTNQPAPPTRSVVAKSKSRAQRSAIQPAVRKSRRKAVQS